MKILSIIVIIFLSFFYSFFLKSSAIKTLIKKEFKKSDIAHEFADISIIKHPEIKQAIVLVGEVKTTYLKNSAQKFSEKFLDKNLIYNKITIKENISNENINLIEISDEKNHLNNNNSYSKIKNYSKDNEKHTLNKVHIDNEYLKNLKNNQSQINKSLLNQDINNDNLNDNNNLVTFDAFNSISNNLRKQGKNINSNINEAFETNSLKLHFNSDLKPIQKKYIFKFHLNKTTFKQDYSSAFTLFKDNVKNLKKFSIIILANSEDIKLTNKRIEKLYKKLGLSNENKKYKILKKLTTMGDQSESQKAQINLIIF